MIKSPNAVTTHFFHQQNPFSDVFRVEDFTWGFFVKEVGFSLLKGMNFSVLCHVLTLTGDVNK